MGTRMKSRAIVFDAYGTLFDVHSVVTSAGDGIAGNLQTLSDLWRRRQLERTWLLTLMERYEDFRRVTESALRASARELRMEITEGEIDRLMEAYLSARCVPGSPGRAGKPCGRAAGDSFERDGGDDRGRSPAQ